MTEALKSVKLDHWPKTAYVGKYVIRTPNGVMSGNAYSKPGMEDTQPYTRADHVDSLLKAERKRALREAAEICDEERKNLNALTSNPPQSAAAVAARNRIEALIEKDQ